MKKLFLAAVAVSVLTIASTAVMAEHHGDKKGKMMEKIDTNADGMVSKTEFMAKHEEQFMKMDVDGDGNLSKDEMKDARGKMKDKMKDRWEKRQEKMAE